MQVPVLLPHAVLSHLFDTVDTVGLNIGSGALARYWRHVKSFCAWVSSEELDGSHIPLTLYGDGARYGQGYDQSKVTGCYLSIPVWRPKSTTMSQWLLWALDADLSLGWRSHYPLYAAFVISLNAAFDGLTRKGETLGVSSALLNSRATGNISKHGVSQETGRSVLSAGDVTRRTTAQLSAPCWISRTGHPGLARRCPTIISWHTCFPTGKIESGLD